MAGVYPGINVEQVLPGTNRHHDLFQRRIAGALAQTINRTLYLSGSAGYRRE